MGLSFSATFARQQLSKFVALVGGPDYAYTLLPPLEQLAMVEESVVHDKAIEALCTVGEAHSTAHLEEHFLPLVQRLAADIGWASRVSACGLFGIVYTPKSRVTMSAAKMYVIDCTKTAMFATILRAGMQCSRGSPLAHLLAPISQAVRKALRRRYADGAAGCGK